MNVLGCVSAWVHAGVCVSAWVHAHTGLWGVRGCMHAWGYAGRPPVGCSAPPGRRGAVLLHHLAAGGTRAVPGQAEPPRATSEPASPALLAATGALRTLPGAALVLLVGCWC